MSACFVFCCTISILPMFSTEGQKCSTGIQSFTKKCDVTEHWIYFKEVVCKKKCFSTLTDGAEDCCYGLVKIGNICKACPAGYFGENCSKPCPPHMYGSGCTQICSCSHCHPVYGCDARNDTATQTFRTFELSTSISDEVNDSKTKMGRNMGILRLNVRITLCILYLINVVLSQEETVLTCSSTPQETVLNNLRQVFKYPESGPYQQGGSCRWLFSAQETDLKIRYRFTTINVDCGDVLNAYDGDSETDPKLSDSVCGVGGSIPGVTTTQKNLFIDFFPDSTPNFNELGFTLEVIAGKDLSDCSVTGTTEAISLADAYVLTSPKFPDDYPVDWTCTYTFTAANGVDQIQFDMVYIDLEDDTQCYDSVKLYDGDSTSSTILAELCGTSPSVQSFTSTGPSLTVHFESDEQSPQAGFYAKVFTLGEETTTTTTLTTTAETEEEEEVTTKTNPEVTEGETGCNRTFFSFWNLCCNLARLCNNWWIFCKTMTQCCKYCGLSSSSLSN